MLGIRKACASDWEGIRRLLDQLEYPGTERFLEERIGRLISHPDELLLVYEGEAPDDGRLADNEDVPEGKEKILGVLSLHFIPQLAVEGDFARISYFAVDGAARSKGIGKEMEEYATRLARERGCELMEVHCHTRRVRAHAFYARQGFVESPKYLIKRL